MKTAQCLKETQLFCALCSLKNANETESELRPMKNAGFKRKQPLQVKV
jgi:hypothetical protein